MHSMSLMGPRVLGVRLPAEYSARAQRVSALLTAIGHDYNFLLQIKKKNLFLITRPQFFFGYAGHTWIPMIQINNLKINA